MPKRDLLRRIDRRPRQSGTSLQVSAGVSGSGSGTVSQRSEYYVGRREGAHVGLFQLENDTIDLRVTDTGNTPYASMGSILDVTNSSWIRLGYPGHPQLRLAAPTANAGDPEQWRGIEIDAAAIVGSVTSGMEADEIGQVAVSIDGEEITPQMPITDNGWLVDEQTGSLLVDG